MNSSGNSPSFRYLKRDPFARLDHVRVTVKLPNGGACDWCGQPRKILYRYGTETDSGKQAWGKGLFCSKSCHDSHSQ